MKAQLQIHVFTNFWRVENETADQAGLFWVEAETEEGLLEAAKKRAAELNLSNINRIEVQGQDQPHRIVEISLHPSKITEMKTNDGQVLRLVDVNEGAYEEGRPVMI